MTFLVECAYCGAGECNCGAKEYTARLIAPPTPDIDWQKPKTPRPESSDKGELVQKENLNSKSNIGDFIEASFSIALIVSGALFIVALVTDFSELGIASFIVMGASLLGYLLFT